MNYSNIPNQVMIAAKAAHEVNRMYCVSIGDYSQVEWDQAPEWMQVSAIQGALTISQDPSITSSALHDKWLEHKLTTGWTYGPTKDADLKTHPAMVPYDQLPEHQKIKDKLFGTVVRAHLGLDQI